MTSNTSALALDIKNINRPFHSRRRIPVSVPQPFDHRAYRSPFAGDSRLFDIPLAVDKGFPQVNRIMPWIPGISTPEGVTLSISAPLILLNTVANGGEAAIRALEGIASAIFVSAIIGIPASITWLSTQVLYPKR